MFTVVIETDGEEHKVEYDSIKELLDDVGMKALFDNGYVTRCSIYVESRRIAGLPIMKWNRLVDQVKSNSVAILKGVDV